MSKPDFPYRVKCAECDAIVIIRKSKPPKTGTYATDNANYPYEFHKCHISKIKPNYKNRLAKDQPITPPPPMERIVEPEDYHMEQQKPKQPEEFSTEEVSFKNADSLYKFGRTFKIIEVTLSKSCRVNKKTIAQLADYEHKDYLISKKPK